MNQDVFHLIVLSREGTLYNNNVRSISSFNTKGHFDVLGSHANFISLIQKEVQIIDVEGKKTQFDISKALIKVFENNVKIYLGIEWFTSTNRSQIS